MGSSQRHARAHARTRAGERSRAGFNRARLQASRRTQGSARFAAERRSEISRRTGEARTPENGLGTVSVGHLCQTPHRDAYSIRLFDVGRWTLDVRCSTLSKWSLPLKTVCKSFEPLSPSKASSPKKSGR